MSLIFHKRLVAPRRIRQLSKVIAPLLPQNSSLIDIGCGDGRLSLSLAQHRPDVKISGVETFLRPNPHIPVTQFDGRRLPYDDDSFDTSLLVDVLHHTEDPMVLLREAFRVARFGVVVKDHLLEGVFAQSILAMMDIAGNPRHGVAMPRNYWTRDQWSEAFQELGVKPDEWQEKLGIYPWPFDLAFGRNLHFVGRLRQGPA